MLQIGTPYTPAATRVVLLGAGELGREVAIEAMRYGLEVIALDRYPHAPAMQVAHASHVVDMRDPVALSALLRQIAPAYIVPEIEAIATGCLQGFADAGVTVVPTARAARLTMDREGIRRLAAEELGLPTSPFRFADSATECAAAAAAVGYPCVIKPVMSSSGHGQSTVREPAAVAGAFAAALAGARGGPGRVIVEGFVAFDYEITLLTVRHRGGTTFCPPIGHLQVEGDYRESWQPVAMAEGVRQEAERIALTVTEALGGWGIFGVELFIQGDDVFFSEVSPRPHDTGLVTLVSQDLSQFALHVRAFLGLPVPPIAVRGPAASAAVVVAGDGVGPVYSGLEEALAAPGTEVRLFAKPEVRGKRRLAVALARGEDVAAARDLARAAAARLRIRLPGEPP
jgi:phosphoribosylglycinamide formyltransferase 2